MIEKENLLSILPHRGKMLLLSKINNYNLKEGIIETEYHVTDKCIFYDSEISGIPTWVGFEFIAQSIAAFAGIRDSLNSSGTSLPKIGFILAVSKVQIDLPFFKSGSIITIKAKEMENMAPVYVFEGEIYLDGKKALKGRLTVMEVDDQQAILTRKEIE